MPDNSPNLTEAELGWRSFFSLQLSAEEERSSLPVRVMAVHRGMIDVLGQGVRKSISSVLPSSAGPEDRPTVGDWLLIARDGLTPVRLLKRSSLFKRPAPGDDRRVQLIAANVDTLFVVTSCNEDFNIARLERYLVLARQVGVRPVVVLTKADLAANPESFVMAAKALQGTMDVELIDGRDRQSVAKLADHCHLGETVALLGSSGVGKSTLINTLTGSDSIATQAVRESDGKGLHTTTVRQMHRFGSTMKGGGWLIDTPGMRELQMSEVASGVAEVFDDIELATLNCRFTDCGHSGEPQCKRLSYKDRLQILVSSGGRNYPLKTKRTRVWPPCGEIARQEAGKGREQWLICIARPSRPNAESFGANVASKAWRRTRRNG